jgi:hypothetical protein
MALALYGCAGTCNKYYYYINMAKEIETAMLTLPLRTSYNLQPVVHTKHITKLALMTGCSQTHTIYNVTGIIAKLFSKAFTKCNNKKWFEVTGFSP